MIFSKIVNFDGIEAGITPKWGRILPAVHWCYHNASYDDLRRSATSFSLLRTATDTDSYIQHSLL